MRLTFALLAAAALASGADAPCDDILAGLHKKPKDLEFVGCKQRADLQGQPREASYRVAGSRAAAVESYLAKELKIKKLRRTCCVWESTENSYRDRKARLYTITMSTEENVIGSRSQWPKIPYFYVTVDQYQEEP